MNRNINSILTPGVYSMIGIGTIFRHNTGSGGGGISTPMDNWIREHVVFYYDVTTVNDNVKPETSKTPSFFWEEGNTKKYCSRLAFYNSIAFDSIPTEADGFTEQELIDYVIDKYELK